MTKYQDSVPIRPRVHTVWLISFDNGERRIAIWDKDATIENVHHFYAIRGNCGFSIGLLGVGEHIISRTLYSYMDDGRFVDQNWNVSLGSDKEKSSGHS